MLNQDKKFNYDTILCHRPASTPPVILDTCTGGLSACPDEKEESDSEFSKALNSLFTMVYIHSFLHPHVRETTEDFSPVDDEGGL